MALEKDFANLVEDEREKEGRLFRRWCALAMQGHPQHGPGSGTGGGGGPGGAKAATSLHKAAYAQASSSSSLSPSDSPTATETTSGSDAPTPAAGAAAVAAGRPAAGAAAATQALTPVPAALSSNPSSSDDLIRFSSDGPAAAGQPQGADENLRWQRNQSHNQPEAREPHEGADEDPFGLFDPPTPQPLPRTNLRGEVTAGFGADGGGDYDGDGDACEALRDEELTEIDRCKDYVTTTSTTTSTSTLTLIADFTSSTARPVSASASTAASASPNAATTSRQARAMTPVGNRYQSPPS